MSLIRIIDFECSDMDPPDAKVIEVGWCHLSNDEGPWQIMAPPESFLCGGVDKIAPGARAAHHLSIEDLANRPPFDPVALNDDAVSDGVTVFAAHNAAYETQFFVPSLPMICTFKSALRVWPQAPSHSNGALRYWLDDQGLIWPIAELTQPAHRAGPDAYVTANILSALLRETTGKQMVQWTREPRYMPNINFGKHKGKEWADAPFDYLDWVVMKSDLDTDTKWNAEQEIRRRREENK